MLKRLSLAQLFVYKTDLLESLPAFVGDVQCLVLRDSLFIEVDLQLSRRVLATRVRLH